MPTHFHMAPGQRAIGLLLNDSSITPGVYPFVDVPGSQDTSDPGSPNKLWSSSIPSLSPEEELLSEPRSPGMPGIGSFVSVPNDQHVEDPLLRLSAHLGVHDPWTRESLAWTPSGTFVDPSGFLPVETVMTPKEAGFWSPKSSPVPVQGGPYGMDAFFPPCASTTIKPWYPNSEYPTPQLMQNDALFLGYGHACRSEEHQGQPAQLSDPYAETPPKDKHIAIVQVFAFCAVCNRKMSSSAYRKHQHTHQLFICPHPDCRDQPKPFKDRRTLARHKNSVHGDKEFKCPYCKLRSYNRLDNLQRHQRDKHEGMNTARH